MFAHISTATTSKTKQKLPIVSELGRIHEYLYQAHNKMRALTKICWHCWRRAATRVAEHHCPRQIRESECPFK